MYLKNVPKNAKNAFAVTCFLEIEGLVLEEWCVMVGLEAVGLDVGMKIRRVE